jgi:hypothetical protein
MLLQSHDSEIKLVTLPFYLAATKKKSCSYSRELCVNGCGDLRGSILWIECVRSVCSSPFRSATAIRRHGTHRANLPLTAFGVDRPQLAGAPCFRQLIFSHIKAERRSAPAGSDTGYAFQPSATTLKPIQRDSR